MLPKFISTCRGEELFGFTATRLTDFSSPITSTAMPWHASWRRRAPMSEEQATYTPSPATQSLDAYLDSFKPTLDGEQGLRIVDQGDADWAMRQIARIDAEAKRDESDAAEAIDRIATW